MGNLNLYMTNDTDELAWPEDSSVYTLETPAMEFINDYKMIKPMAIDSETKADEMKPVMLNLHMSLISIVNSQGHFLGIVSLDDLSDQNFIRKQAEGFLRSEIEAVDFMTPRKDLLAFDRAEIEHAAINDVIDALKKAVAKNAWCWIAVHTRYGAFLQ